MASTRSLGVLTMDVLVRNAAFETGMDKTARIADKRFREMERRAKKFGTALGISIAGGVTAITAGMTLYLKNTIEAEKVQAQLTSRIKDTGAAAGRTLQQLSAQADKLQSLTIFDDESIGMAQAALLTFTQIQGLNFDRTIEAATDLATVMGTDVADAAKVLGKALSDPEKGIGALRKAGITLTDDQKAMVKQFQDTGNVAGAQGVILDALAGKMGTAAEAARNTLGGALQSLGNSFDNLLEGDTGGAGLKGTTKAVNDLDDALNNPSVKRGIDNIAEGLLGMATAAANAVGKLSELAQVGLIGAGKLGLSDASNDALKERRKQLQANIDVGKEWRKEEGNIVERLTGGRDFAAYDSMVAEVARIDALLDYQPTGNGNGRRYKPGTAVAAGGRSAGVPSPDEAATGASSKALKQAKKDSDDLAESMRAAAEAQASWHSRILDMSADMEGPTAQVMRDYDKSMEELTGQFNEGKVRLDDYAKAQDLLAQIRDKDLTAVKAQLTPLQEVNAAVDEQMQLVGMSADAQEIWNNLKFLGADADEAQRQQIIQSTKALQDYRAAMADQVDAMDALRDGSQDFLKDLIGGTKGWKDSFLDALDSIEARFLDLVTQNFVDQLFGKRGDPGGGTAGNWFGNLFGSMFGNSMPTGATGDVAIGASSYGGAAGGSWWQSLLSMFGGGGHAAGGGVQPWKIYPVNELGMEGLTVNGRDYLMTGSQSGMVTPHNRMGRSPNGPATVYQTINVQGKLDNRSRDQMARDAAREMSIATRRHS